jgi:hypothetical protein
MRPSILTVIGASALLAGSLYGPAAAAEEPCHPHCNPPQTLCVSRLPKVPWHCEANSPEFMKSPHFDLFINGAILRATPQKE